MFGLGQEVVPPYEEEIKRIEDYWKYLWEKLPVSKYSVKEEKPYIIRYDLDDWIIVQLKGFSALTYRDERNITELIRRDLRKRVRRIVFRLPGELEKRFVRMGLWVTKRPPRPRIPGI